MKDAAGEVNLIQLSHCQALYNHDNNVIHEGLKLHHRLKEKDVYPDNFWVQKVSEAAHLSIQSSVDGL